ncbi:hypothetical protein DH86_00002675 [Scytalidium sp. 3C]|nr:hypothetical protein DH86_00002675 [Scytalidium sp. 3C]
MAEDVAHFIEQHRLTEPTLIGHSMGAKTAMTLALRSPDLIRDIVSVDNAPIDAALLGSFAKYIQGMKKIEQQGVTRQGEADRILAEYEEILGTGLDNLGDFPYKNPDEKRFNKPALFVRGTKSHYVADEAIPIIGRFFPKFELVDIEAGHWVISEQPEAFRKAVVEFLKPKE